MPSWLRLLARIGSGVLAACAAALTVAAVHDWYFGDGHTEPGILAGLSVFFAGITALASWATVRGLRPGRFADDGDVRRSRVGDELLALEQRILKLAARNEGVVTVAELALDAAIPLEKAEAALDALAQRGRADVQVTEGGATVYSVRGFLAAAEKASAKGLLE